MNRRAIFLRNGRGRRSVLETRMSALWLGAVVATNLYDALEMDVHAVGELESLEICEADDRCAGSEVLDLLESVKSSKKRQDNE